MPRGTTYERSSVEFSRVLAFSDGVFAIAMTLLVVGITVPKVHPDASSVAPARRPCSTTWCPNFISFFISFAVIGRYWAAHHQFFALLARMR